MSDEPDPIVDHWQDRCPCLDDALHGNLSAEVVSVSGRIDLPEVTPVVTQHRRLAVQRPTCGTRVVAPVPDPKRCERAGVLNAAMVPQSKGEMAFCELDRLRVENVRFGVVLDDPGYGCSAVFWHGLDARGLAWAVGIAKNQKVHDPGVQLVEPAAAIPVSHPDRRAIPKLYLHKPAVTERLLPPYKSA